MQFGNWGQNDANKPDELKASAPTGTEVALKAMGLGDVMNAAKTLATSGSIQKILGFAEALEGLDIGQLKQDVAFIRAWIERQDGAARDGGNGGVLTGSDGLHAAADEPRASAGDRAA